MYLDSKCKGILGGFSYINHLMSHLFISLLVSTEGPTTAGKFHKVPITSSQQMLVGITHRAPGTALGFHATLSGGDVTSQKIS